MSPVLFLFLFPPPSSFLPQGTSRDAHLQRVLLDTRYPDAHAYTITVHWLVAKLLLCYKEEGDVDRICVIIVIWAFMVGE